MNSKEKARGVMKLLLKRIALRFSKRFQKEYQDFRTWNGDCERKHYQVVIRVRGIVIRHLPTGNEKLIDWI